MSAAKLLLKPEQLLQMFERQYKTNNLYNKEEWKEQPAFYSRFMAAADTELSEFLEEITGLWKWYEKRNPKFDANKALFEAVDVVHFMLASILKVRDVKKVCQTVVSDQELLTWWADAEVSFPMTNVQVEDPCFYEKLKYQYDRFWNATRILWNDYDCVGEGYAWIAIATRHMLCFISGVCNLLGYTADEFFQAYVLKNDRNQARVLNGVMDGVDVKSAESELTL